MRFSFALCVVIIAGFHNSVAVKASAGNPAKQSGTAATLDYRIINTYPHDPKAWTQGLVIDNGELYEGTGLVGRSTLRKVKPETGEILKEHTLDKGRFGEGITIYKNKIFQLTLRAKVILVYDKNSFKPLKEVPYTKPGWGITHDGKHLILSDGTATLCFLDPETFKEIRQINVRGEKGPITQLNELEYIKGEIYSNIWKSDQIARICPQTGKVLGWINLKGLLKPEDRRGHRPNVLNGIAYDPKTDRLLVTGKFWPKLYEIKLKKN